MENLGVMMPGATPVLKVEFVAFKPSRRHMEAFLLMTQH